MNGNGLHARHIRHAYRGKAVLHDASLSLRPGEVVALLGANGAGKSTLLRILLGLLVPDAGAVELNGVALTEFSRRALASQVAYVPQVHAMPFPYSVRQVVMMGRLPVTGLFGAPQAADHEAAEQAMQRLGIRHLAERIYTELSGGERQLVLIGRALAQGSRLLVMDEPASGLDYGNQIALVTLLRSLADDGYGILKSTHHPDHVFAGADRVAILQGGLVIADGPPATILDRERLSALYGIAVAPVRLPDGRQVVLPAMPPSASSFSDSSQPTLCKEFS